MRVELPAKNPFTDERSESSPRPKGEVAPSSARVRERPSTASQINLPHRSPRSHLSRKRATDWFASLTGARSVRLKWTIDRPPLLIDL